MIFVDSNVIVYSVLADSEWHPLSRRALRQLRAERVAVWVSRQVLRECLAVLTRSQLGAPPRPLAEVLARLQLCERSYEVAEDSAEVTKRLYDLVEQIPVGGKQIHDANLVATMLVYGLEQLLTHNVDDFRRFDSLIDVVPLSRWSD